MPASPNMRAISCARTCPAALRSTSGLFGSIIFSACLIRIIVVTGRRNVVKYPKTTTAPRIANSIEKTSAAFSPDRGSGVSLVIYDFDSWLIQQGVAAYNNTEDVMESVPGAVATG